VRTYRAASGVRAESILGFFLPLAAPLAETSEAKTAGRQRVRFSEPAASRLGHRAGASSALPPQAMYACTCERSSEEEVCSGQWAVGSGFTSRNRPRGLPRGRLNSTACCPPHTAHCCPPALPIRPSYLIPLAYSDGGGYPVFGIRHSGLRHFLPIEGVGGSWGARMRSMGLAISCELAHSRQDTPIWGRAGGFYLGRLALPLRPGLRHARLALANMPGTVGRFGSRERGAWSGENGARCLTPCRTLRSLLRAPCSPLERLRRGWPVDDRATPSAPCPRPGPASRPSTAEFFLLFCSFVHYRGGNHALVPFDRPAV